MRIGVNTRLLLHGKMDGIGWFTYETLSRIVVSHPEHQFYFFFDRKPDPRFFFASNVHPVVLCPQARHPLLWILYFEVSMKCALKKHKIDFLFSPECYIPLRLGIPTLSVFHDLNYEHAKDYLKPSHQMYMDYFSRRFAGGSTRIATVSTYSKQDIVDTYQIDPNKVDVVYNGANEGYRPLSLEEQRMTRARFSQGARYFIFIGTILKRKNLSTLLKSFDRFKATDKEGIKLLVVGNRVWWQDELEAEYNAMKYQKDVVFIGRAPQEDLFKLLGSSIALVYPSLFEGFGIPILEAYNAEVPVITSNCTSMPEVAGGAAILVEPTDSLAMAAAMGRIAKDPLFCANLVAKGCEQRKRFSWDITANKLWESMMKTVNARRNNEKE
ncbi:MAG: glycosyltransferase family 4 protein [Bacteroidales bacterium]|nr:glycosyltransferase family 4 protein [Bacteroidales bacterium]